MGKVWSRGVTTIMLGTLGRSRAVVLLTQPVARTWLANNVGRETKLRQTFLRRFGTKCVMNRLMRDVKSLKRKREMLKLFFVIVCSELKRRLKAEQKAKEKAEKEEAKALVAAIHENQITSSKKEKIKEEDISPNVNIKALQDRKLIYREFRLSYHFEKFSFFTNIT